MASIEPTTASTQPQLAPAGQLPLQWTEDDDLALGCESANPALQIERWGQEDAAPVRQFY